ncbi:hypothetical protein HYX17_01530 [Candidatus Woesearchaeota archaeon]|nr:hypothetical protein [Candidatus Woesearchaeota archaeon]
MRIVHIPETLFGKFYYDPISHQGVALSKDTGPVKIVMANSYDPYMHSDFDEYEIKEESFKKLLDAADRRSKIEVLTLIYENFVNDNLACRVRDY